jgi:hypothetical protein
MSLLIIVCCKAACVVAGGLHSVVTNYQLLKALHLLLMEDSLMLL